MVNKKDFLKIINLFKITCKNKETMVLIKFGPNTVNTKLKIILLTVWHKFNFLENIKTYNFDFLFFPISYVEGRCTSDY